MSINHKQKGLAHIYKSAAKLGDQDYRNLLRAAAGVRSCADPEMSQDGFERLMASLESVLDDRLARGEVPTPRDRHITSLSYWRSKLPREGRINSRQEKLIRQLWAQLQPHLPTWQQGNDYLAAIVAKSTGNKHIGRHALTREEASLVINALRDRLSYAVRATQPKPNPHPTPKEKLEDAPF